LRGAIIADGKAAIFLVVTRAVPALTQLPDRRVPRFEDYPVRERYIPPIAEPRLVNHEQRRYRAAIANGVRKGFGVLHKPEGTERRGPNFAGRYIVVQWGCVAECLEYAIVDAKNGTIYQPPVPGSHIACFDSGMLDLRVDSRMMVVKTKCAMGDNEKCDRDSYLRDDDHFRHLSHYAMHMERP
jgi:hypothetical protein